MIQKFQYRNLERDDKITEEDIMNFKHGSMGHILEVDVEYPKELHDLHNDCPLAPEVKNVKANMLSVRKERMLGMILKSIYSSY